MGCLIFFAFRHGLFSSLSSESYAYWHNCPCNICLWLIFFKLFGHCTWFCTFVQYSILNIPYLDVNIEYSIFNIFTSRIFIVDTGQYSKTVAHFLWVIVRPSDTLAHIYMFLLILVSPDLRIVNHGIYCHCVTVLLYIQHSFPGCFLWLLPFWKVLCKHPLTSRSCYLILHIYN